MASSPTPRTDVEPFSLNIWREGNRENPEWPFRKGIYIIGVLGTKIDRAL